MEEVRFRRRFEAQIDFNKWLTEYFEKPTERVRVGGISLTTKLIELEEYIVNLDGGQAWDDHDCFHAIEILAEFAPDDWQRLVGTWGTRGQNFKECFLSIITEIKPSDYIFAVPLVLQVLRRDELVSQMENIRHFLKTVPKDDPVWRVDPAIISDLTKTKQTLSYRAHFMQEVLERLSS